MPTQPTAKREIRAMVARGDLREALEASLNYAEYCGSADEINGLTTLNGRFAQHTGHWATGQIAYEEFSREQARIAYALIGIIDQLPQQPAPNAGRKKNLDETTFKKRLLLLVLFSKGIALLQVWHYWGMGTFNIERALTVFTLLCPTFVASLSLMLGDYLRAYREVTPLSRRLVAGPLISIAYGLFPFYTILLLYLLRLGTTAQEISFPVMCILLSTVETIVGGYVGQVVTSVFKGGE